jgi:hypothetical protein
MTLREAQDRSRRLIQLGKLGFNYRECVALRRNSTRSCRYKPRSGRISMSSQVVTGRRTTRGATRRVAAATNRVAAESRCLPRWLRGDGPEEVRLGEGYVSQGTAVSRYLRKNPVLIWSCWNSY